MLAFYLDIGKNLSEMIVICREFALSCFIYYIDYGYKKERKSSWSIARIIQRQWIDSTRNEFYLYVIEEEEKNV